MTGVLAEVPAVQWREWLQADYARRLIPWSDIQAQMPLLHDAASTRTRPAIAELGTRTGQSTSALLAGASETGGHVWSVDPGEVTVPSWWAETGLWSFLPADDMSADATRWVPRRLDVLFIDTSHLYGHTMDELHEYVPRVRPGGIVLCHDVELARDDEIMRDKVRGDAWLTAAASGPQYPVAAALDDYCAETGLTWTRQDVPAVRIPDKPFYGLGTIAIPGA